MSADIITYLNSLGPKLLSSREAAQILSCHLETLYKWVKTGRISHVRVGGRVKFSPAHLTTYLERRTV